MTGWGRSTLGAERLRAVVASAYAVHLVDLEPVEAGADAAARTWRGTDAAGGSWAVREASGGSPAGLEAMAAVQAPGVPQPVRTVDSRLWSAQGDVRVSLVPWVVGRSALEVEPSREQWTAFGCLLAAVHATPPVSLPPSLPRDDRSAGAVAALVAAADTACATASDALGHDGAAAWAAGRARVGRVLDDVRRPGTSGDEGRVLCHGDPHRGNLVVGDDRCSVWLIDWDDAALSWRERDLLMVVEGLPGFSEVSDEERAWFEEGYGPLRVDAARLAHHRGVRALEDVALFAADVQDTGRSDEQRAWALGLVRAHLADDGILALAERSAARLDP
ncbi:MAG TPA: phosphotransferase [Candidatus Nanopelagicales bacterium]|nr:phosphotransferase [Candidatus Nanopelagicales bacterium]